MKAKTVWKDWETYTEDGDFGHWLEKTESRSGTEEVWFEWEADVRWVNIFGFRVGSVRLSGAKNRIIGD